MPGKSHPAAKLQAETPLDTGPLLMKTFWEPPIGIEPMTYASRVACALPRAC